MGIKNLNSGGPKYNIEGARFPEGFDIGGAYIAVLRVLGNIQFNENVLPISIYSAEKNPEDVPAQHTAWQNRVSEDSFLNNPVTIYII